MISCAEILHLLYDTLNIVTKSDGNMLVNDNTQLQLQVRICWFLNENKNKPYFILCVIFRDWSHLWCNWHGDFQHIQVDTDMLGDG